MSAFSADELYLLNIVCKGNEFIEDAEQVYEMVIDAQVKDKVLYSKTEKRKVENELTQFKKAFESLSLDSRYWLYENMTFIREIYTYLFTDMQNVLNKPYYRIHASASEARNKLKMATLLLFLKYELKADTTASGPLTCFVELLIKKCEMSDKAEEVAREITTMYRKGVKNTKS